MNGAVIELLGGTGLSLALSRVPHWRRPSLEARLAPYLRDAAPPSALLNPPGQGGGPLGRLAGPALAELAASLDRIVGGTASVRRRLERLGARTSVEQFRQEQVVFACAGALLGFGLIALRVATGAGPPVESLAGLTVLATAGGFTGRDQWLTHQVTLREARMAAELPAVAELLALALSAGESPVGALERISRVSRGELSRELSRALADARAGATLSAALTGVARRTGLPALERFVDGMTVAITRGTPLAEVLRAQAVDARDAGRRALLEAAGRKEIAMLVPVVFLVLPVTVLFALFPGAITLTTLAR
ncbi:MAG: type II secretion system F family protein [Mycobacteriales bacterium]